MRPLALRHPDVVVAGSENAAPAAHNDFPRRIVSCDVLYDRHAYFDGAGAVLDQMGNVRRR